MTEVAATHARMRTFLAGASGVIGVRLPPLLVTAGHVVAGLTRAPQKASTLRSLGAEPVVCNVFESPNSLPSSSMSQAQAQQSG
jgi:hypothetical protein